MNFWCKGKLREKNPKPLITYHTARVNDCFNMKMDGSVVSPQFGF